MRAALQGLKRHWDVITDGRWKRFALYLPVASIYTQVGLMKNPFPEPCT